MNKLMAAEEKSHDKVYILDTNIVLNDAKNIYKILDEGRNLVVLPETTLDEIDSKKTGFAEINYQAREFARILSSAEILSSQKDSGLTVTTIALNKERNLIVDIVSKERYDIDKDTEKNIINDRRILAVASDCKKIYKDRVKQEKDIIFLSLDVMARTRAISYNLMTEPLLEKDGSNENKEYIKELLVDPEELATLAHKDIKEVDPDYKPENYSYHFKAKDGNSSLAVIENGRIQVIDEDELRKNHIAPKNMEQQFAMDALLNRSYNVVLIEALAGTGKTLLSIAAALRMVQDGRYEKISYIRNSIESLDKGEDVGYLSGNEEKFKIYTYPLYDTLAMIVRAKRKGPTDLEEEERQVKELIDKNRIETPWVGEIRGRTITNSVVILDEAQNMSKKTMQTIISRLDKNCKLIIIGSNKQIDNQYVNKHTNGLASIIKASGMESEEIKMFATKFTKVVRGPITAWAERVFEN